MIRYFLKKNKDSDFKEIDHFKDGSWIYVVGQKQDELYQLAHNHSLDSRILLDVLDEDEMPRLERDGTTGYLFSRFVYQGGELSAETQVVLLVFNEDLFISVSSLPIPGVEKLIDEFDLDNTAGVEMFLRCLRIIVETYDRQLTKISRQVKTIRQKLRNQAIKNQDFVDFVVIEEELNEFLTVLNPTSAILKRLLVGKHYKFSKNQEYIIQDVALNTEQLIVESSAILQSIVNIRDTYSTIATNNLNKIIRVLTVIATVLAVPTLIASLYGMNVGLPFENDKNAFLIVLLISSAISLGLLAIFKLKKWL